MKTKAKSKEERKEGISYTLEKLRHDQKLNLKMDALIQINLLYCAIHDGFICEKCGFIQGTEKDGFEKNYCDIAKKRLEQKSLHSLEDFNKLEVKADGTTTDGIPSKTKVLGILPNEL